jgi:uncharacterized protein YqeY
MTEDAFLTLLQRIRAELKEAMRNRDDPKATTLKGILAAFTYESVALGRTPDTPLRLEEAHRVLRRLLKQREEACALYEKGGRGDLAQQERQEAAIIGSFLPPMLDEAAIRQLIAQARKEHPDATEGQLIGFVMKAAAGQAEGSVVRRVVAAMLQENE